MFILSLKLKLTSFQNNNTRNNYTNKSLSHWFYINVAVQSRVKRFANRYMYRLHVNNTSFLLIVMQYCFQNYHLFWLICLKMLLFPTLLEIIFNTFTSAQLLVARQDGSGTTELNGINHHPIVLVYYFWLRKISYRPHTDLVSLWCESWRVALL